jgi:hypothetical protein
MKLVLIDLVFKFFILSEIIILIFKFISLVNQTIFSPLNLQKKKKNILEKKKKIEFLKENNLNKD